MSLSLYNTLTGRVEPLAPLDPPRVRLYVCGLTVYSRGHVGNYRTFVAVDLLRRVLRYQGYQVTHVMNITDVDDRIIALAAEAGRDLAAFTAPHIQSFREDMATLRNQTPEIVPRATDHVADMVRLIQSLQARGHTYDVEGSVYFRISTFPEYGRLSRLDVSGIKAGARVDTDKYDKENARDFALWKAKAGEPEWAQWDAPFGRGRPGWHIECSAMSMRYLGETFDLHAGGVDLIFPHHENEIAQSVCGTGKPFVRHWVHVDHLLIENETMSKSKGNVFTIPELIEKGHKPDAIRYLLLTAHYRTQLNFTWEGLKQAAAALQRVQGLLQRLGEVDRDGPVAPELQACLDRARDTFDRALSDDLNTPEALAAVHVMVGEVNALLAGGTVTRAGADAARAQVEAMDAVLGVFVPAGEEDRLSAEEQELLDERQDARKRRDFARADQARRKLEEMGIILEDTPKGTRWRRVR
ncbi:MAG TPA: cysteine--tRNA ligase [Vicinamibacteria bacterium]